MGDTLPHGAPEFRQISLDMLRLACRRASSDMWRAPLFGVILHQHTRQIPSLLAVIIVILLFWFFLGHRILRCFLGFYHDQYFQQFGGVPEH